MIRFILDFIRTLYIQYNTNFIIANILCCFMINEHYKVNATFVGNDDNLLVVSTLSDIEIDLNKNFFHIETE